MVPLDRLANPLHQVIAIASAVLVLASPWLGMYQRMPEEPGIVNLTHVMVGLALLPLAALYFAGCVHGGRWRLYFPWLDGRFRTLRDDVTGMLRGERPASEGGGLFATIEGLLLLALLAAALTGALWFFTQGLESAIVWRGQHMLAARAFVVLLLLHVVAVALHLLDFVRG